MSEIVQLLGYAAGLTLLSMAAGFGLVFGAWAGVHAGTWAFGGFNINFKQPWKLVVSRDGDSRE